MLRLLSFLALNLCASIFAQQFEDFTGSLSDIEQRAIQEINNFSTSITEDVLMARSPYEVSHLLDLLSDKNDHELVYSLLSDDKIRRTDIIKFYQALEIKIKEEPDFLQSLEKKLDSLARHAKKIPRNINARSCALGVSIYFALQDASFAHQNSFYNPYDNKHEIYKRAYKNTASLAFFFLFSRCTFELYSFKNNYKHLISELLKVKNKTFLKNINEFKLAIKQLNLEPTLLSSAKNLKSIHNVTEEAKLAFLRNIESSLLNNESENPAQRTSEKLKHHWLKFWQKQKLKKIKEIVKSNNIISNSSAFEEFNNQLLYDFKYYLSQNENNPEALFRELEHLRRTYLEFTKKNRASSFAKLCYSSVFLLSGIISYQGALGKNKPMPSPLFPEFKYGTKFDRYMRANINHPLAIASGITLFSCMIKPISNITTKGLFLSSKVLNLDDIEILERSLYKALSSDQNFVVSQISENKTANELIEDSESRLLNILYPKRKEIILGKNNKIKPIPKTNIKKDIKKMNKVLTHTKSITLDDANFAQNAQDFINSSPSIRIEKLMEYLVSGDSLNSQTALQLLKEVDNNKFDTIRFLQLLAKEVETNPRALKLVQNSLLNLKINLKRRYAPTPSVGRCATSIILYFSVTDLIYSSRPLYLEKSQKDDDTLAIFDLMYHAFSTIGQNSTSLLMASFCLFDSISNSKKMALYLRHIRGPHNSAESIKTLLQFTESLKQNPQILSSAQKLKSSKEIQEKKMIIMANSVQKELEKLKILESTVESNVFKKLSRLWGIYFTTQRYKKLLIEAHKKLPLEAQNFTYLHYGDQRKQLDIHRINYHQEILNDFIVWLREHPEDGIKHLFSEISNLRKVKVEKTLNMNKAKGRTKLCLAGAGMGLIGLNYAAGSFNGAKVSDTIIDSYIREHQQKIFLFGAAFLTGLSCLPDIIYRVLAPIDYIANIKLNAGLDVNHVRRIDIIKDNPMIHKEVINDAEIKFHQISELFNLATEAANIVENHPSLVVIESENKNVREKSAKELINSIAEHPRSSFSKRKLKPIRTNCLQKLLLFMH